MSDPGYDEHASCDREVDRLEKAVETAERSLHGATLEAAVDKETIAELESRIAKALELATYHAQGPHGCDDILCTECAIGRVLRADD